ncbi:MAG TPA: hypothetical protein VHT92_12550 [Candidatus Cybelea sp.]|nr:hypothetical protein [Candidatus Cybelea sp.]
MYDELLCIVCKRLVCGFKLRYSSRKSLLINARYRREFLMEYVDGMPVFFNNF